MNKLMILVLMLSLTSCRFDDLTGGKEPEVQYVQMVPNAIQGTVTGDSIEVIVMEWKDAKYRSVKVCDNNNVCTPLPFNGSTYSYRGSLLLIMGVQTAFPTATHYIIEYVK